MSSTTTTLNIIQYNVNHSREKAQLPFLQGLDPYIHHILAVQEPWKNPQAHTTVKHPGYFEILPQGQHPRTCLYISKTLSTETWTTTTTSPDIITAHLMVNQTQLHIHNCYNPPSSTSQQHSENLNLLHQQINQPGEHILLGDFNLHHPQWGGSNTFTQHKSADQLINILQTHHLHQLTPPGITTWENSRSHQTLDLTFGSIWIQERVTACNILDQLSTSSDHYPIITSIQHDPRQVQETSPRPQWKKARWDRIQKQLDQTLPLLLQMPLDSPAHLDQGAVFLQDTIQQCIQNHIPYAKPSLYAKMLWTQECSEATQKARQARRQWKETHLDQDYKAYITANQHKKRQIRRDTRRIWRETVAAATANPKQIWKLAKWARERAGKPSQLPQFPALKDSSGTLQTTGKGKADVLAQHFFPAPVTANLSDIPGHTYPEELPIPCEVDEAEIHAILKWLPPDKAPGPDRIPNRFLKECSQQLAPFLAHFFTKCIQASYHPQTFKESNTVVLKKPQKPDYTSPKAYRPIALLNTMAKLLEAVIAKKMSAVTEEQLLLPDTQMGARPKRSTISALEYITEQVQTIWKHDNTMVASMLCLDISGAFDKVSHARLLHNLRDKGFPTWMIAFIQSFLTGRTTSLVLGNFTDSQRETTTGIPQGSTISPILFLFFAAELLPTLQEGPTSAVGFVDDTNILTYSKSTEDNCRALERAHAKCKDWADRHGAKFAPEKYQLIHFTRKPKRHNMKATVQIPGFEEGPVPDLRLLGVQVDTKLKWGPHIKKTQAKGKVQLTSLTALSKSTWGATFLKARHIYTAVVKPVLTYGCPIWYTPGEDTTSKNTQNPILQHLQAQALRTITGAYRSTPIALLHHEAQVSPLDLSLAKTTLTHTRKTCQTQAWNTIQKRCQEVATQIRANQRQKQRRRNQGRNHPAHYTRAERLLQTTQQGGIWELSFGSNNNWIPWVWEQRWAQQQEQKRQELREHPSSKRISTAWDTGWNIYQHKIHSGLSRAHSTMATLLRTEHIGLNAYLYKRKVPGHYSPACTCGHQRQDPRHILMHCPEQAGTRNQMMQQAGTTDFRTLLSGENIKTVTKWVMEQGLLGQFDLALEMEKEAEREEGY